MILFLSDAKYTEASSASNVNATVKISVCGNEVVENGEDCENGDLQGKTCSNLGYSSGNLSCDISCSFDTSSCVVPSITPTNIAPTELTSLLPAGYFTIPSTDSIVSTSSLTTTSQLTINVPVSGGTGSIVLPDNLVITKSNGSDFDPTSLTTADVATSSLSGFSSGLTTDGAVQFGISGTTLEFSTPITLNIYVGTSLNGQTLNVVRSASSDSGWTSDGIVSPATCIVTDGLCTFQANKASYFATTRAVIPTPTPTPAPTATPTPTPTPTTTTSSSSSSNGSSTTTSSTSTSTPTPTQTPLAIPDVLRLYTSYLNNNARIRISDLFNVVTIWVNDWKEVLAEELIVSNGETIQTKGRKCDVNNDGRCDIKDLSILLYYVER